MIRAKAYILREIKQLEKRKKKLEIELLTIHKVGEDIFDIVRDIAQKEIIKIEGKIEAHNWTAFTSEKNLPKIKTKVKKEVKK
jgi:pyruvate-formate lyase-activating enzyme